MPEADENEKIKRLLDKIEESAKGQYLNALSWSQELSGILLSRLNDKMKDRE